MTARAVTLLGFGLLAVAIIGWSVVTARRPSSITLAQPMERATTSRVVRLLFVLVWAWVGWHLFARGSGAFE